ncbi:MAG: hypothetical protein DVB33_09680 [Verrucomicrobia bacterium]|jgi:hypothetical protein|nr:MAG: hypothetical protein DVB33_09680 [Verrucomicrobiota bacterium]
MNISELSASNLRQAATLKERIEQLQMELNSILGTATIAPVANQKPQGMSPAAKAKLSAKLKEVWAKRKAAKQAATTFEVAQPKSKLSSSAKANLSAKLKEVWAKRKAAKQAATTVKVGRPKSK